MALLFACNIRFSRVKAHMSESRLEQRQAIHAVLQDLYNMTKLSQCEGQLKFLDMADEKLS